MKYIYLILFLAAAAQPVHANTFAEIEESYKSLQDTNEFIKRVEGHIQNSEYQHAQKMADPALHQVEKDRLTLNHNEYMDAQRHRVRVYRENKAKTFSKESDRLAIKIAAAISDLKNMQIMANAPGGDFMKPAVHAAQAQLESLSYRFKKSLIKQPTIAIKAGRVAPAIGAAVAIGSAIAISTGNSSAQADELNMNNAKEPVQERNEVEIGTLE